MFLGPLYKSVVGAHLDYMVLAVALVYFNKVRGFRAVVL